MTLRDRLLRLSIGLLLGLFALLCVARVLIMTPLGHGLITNTLNNLSVAGQSISIDGLSGDPLGAFQIAHITAADNDGIWLEADDIELRWSGLSLLRRRLNIQSLTTQTINILRTPEIENASDGSPTSSSGLPFRAAALDALQLVEIEIGDDIIRQGASLTVTGAANYTSSSTMLDLDIVPIDGPDDRATANIIWTRNKGIDGDLSVIGEKGGWLASLIGLSTDDNFDLKLTGTTNSEGWQLQSLLNVNGDAAAEITSIRTQSNLISSAKLNLEPFPQLASLVSRIGPALQINSEIGIGQHNEHQLTANMESDTLTASVSGPFTLKAGDISNAALNINTSTTDLPAIIGNTALTAGTLNLSGQAIIEGSDQIQFDGYLDISDLSTAATGALNISGPLSFSEENNKYHFLLDLDADAQDPAGDAFTSRFGKDLSVAIAAIRGPADQAFRLENASLKTGTASVDMGGTSENITGRFMSSLAPFELGEESKLEGDFALQLDDNEGLSANAKAALMAPDLGGWTGLTSMDDPLKFEVSAVRSADGTLHIDKFSARRTGVGLKIEDAYISADNSGELIAALTVDKLTSPAGINIENTDFQLDLANGPNTGFEFNSTLQFGSAGMNATEFEETVFEWTGTGALNDWSSQISLTAPSTLGDINMRLAPSLQKGNWSTGSINGDFLGLSVSGNATGNLDQPERLTANLELAGTPPEQFRIVELTANAALMDGDFRIDANLAHLNIADLDKGDIQSSFRGELDGHVQGELNWQSAYRANGRSLPVDLKLSSSSEIGQGLHLLSVGGSIDDFPIGTPQPVEIRQTSDGLTATGRLNALEGIIGFDLANQQSGLAADINIQDISIGLLTDALLGQAAVGELDGEAVFRSSPDIKLFELNARTDGLTDPERRFSPTQIVLNSNYTDGVVLSTANIKSDILDLDGAVSLGVDWQGDIPQFSPDYTTQLEIKGSGAIAELSDLLLPSNINLAGEVDIDVMASLLTSGPNVSGHLELNNGLIEHSELGVSLEQLNIFGTLDGSALDLERFSAEDGRGGTLLGEGRASFNGQGSLALQSENMRWISRDDITANLSGPIEATLEGTSLRLNADMTVDRSEIDLGALPTVTRPTLPVRFEDEPQTVGEPPSAVELDIRVRSPGQIFLEGLGLDAELAVDARITGDASTPIVRGNANIVRGNYTFATQRFDFVDSAIRLRPGEPPIRLDIRAEREDADVTAIVEITGTPERPVISLSAEPDLPEDEILSRVLFGRSPGELTPVQAARLASTLAGLAGGSGFDVLGGLESALFLDRVDLTETADGAAVLTTGKFVAPNVYVEVQNQADGATGVSVEWEPFENITVTGASDNEDGQQIGLRWQRDFDRIKRRKPDDAPEEIANPP
ncbi:MAG: translocation/assembly module TamB domain-containing protein [Pseudomonadota bacterium]